MMESLKTRLEFPSPVIQAQTVRSLVAAVLKEKGSNGQISWSCAQGPALEALWQQCCSDCAVVCSACCDTLVLLVDQGHADLDYILNGVLNLLPSARHTQGLIKVIRRLLEMQADQSNAHFTCPYSIRSSPHPYVTALENRADCWPALLFEIDDFIQKAVDRDKAAYITMLAPFLRYLYCQPHRQPKHALLRQSLLRVMLPIQGGSRSAPQNKEQETLSPVSDRLLLCLCQLVPHMQVDSVEAVLELCAFVGALLQDLTGTSGDQWKPEKAALALQLLCACRRCLELNGDCRPIIGLIQQLVPACQDLLLDELVMGVALLLLEAPSDQLTSLLRFALSLVPEQAEASPWLSPVLILPVLQLLSCLGLTEPLSDQNTHSTNHRLAHSLLRSISRPADKPQQLA